MEEIMRELQKISEILQQNQTSVWITYLSSLGPLILTGISVFIAIKQHKQNQALQKQIANRDAANLLRQNVLDVYNVYFNGLRVVEQYMLSGVIIFAFRSILQQWMKEFQEAYDALWRTFNQARLMLNDDQLLQALMRSFHRFSELYSYVNSYWQRGLLLNTMKDAWMVISSKYAIEVENYVTLSQNSSAMKELRELCDNEHTQEINRLMEAFKASMGDETFDKHFKEYIRITQL